MAFAGVPETSGANFTKTTHTNAEGSTDPANNRYDGKPFVVCVTGAGKGLGFHIALAYAKAGVSGLVISSRTQSDLDALSDEIKNVNSKVEILSQICDTLKEDDVKRLANATKGHFGRLDVVVANAGVISKYLEDGSLPVGIMEDLDFERVIDINFLGTVRIARHFTPLLLETKGAQTFIVITSLAAHFVHSSLTSIAYNNSKRVVCHLAELMANDHGKDGLLAYAVHPGAVVTPQSQCLTISHLKKIHCSLTLVSQSLHVLTFSSSKSLLERRRRLGCRLDGRCWTVWRLSDLVD